MLLIIISVSFYKNITQAIFYTDLLEIIIKYNFYIILICRMHWIHFKLSLNSTFYAHTENIEWLGNSMCRYPFYWGGLIICYAAARYSGINIS